MLVNIPLITLLVVLVLISLRQVTHARVQIWQAMLFGALVILITGSLSLQDALRSIHFDVMLFLAAMFIVGNALEESGYLAHISFRYFKRARTRNSLVMMILAGSGVASAVLMNDTLAIVGTPVVLLLARKHGMSPQILLLALAFGVTIGSVASPIGNPQNLLIALNGTLRNPFLTFLQWLLVPTLINLWLTSVVMRRFFRDDFHDAELKHTQEPIRDKQMAFLAKLSVQIIVVLIAVKIIAAMMSIDVTLHLTHIAVAGALPVLIGSERRMRIVRELDWQTLVFFAAMFVLMESVWRTGFFQSQVERAGIPVTSPGMIAAAGLVISQFVSNVPLVALYQPLLLEAGTGEAGFMALAASSTIAGNMFIFGAASNVIIIQNAERRAGVTVTFWEFARVGLPVTLVNMGVYWVWLLLMTAA